MKTIAAAILIITLLTDVASSQAKREPGENSNNFTEKSDAAVRRAAEARRQQMELDAKYKAALDKTKAPDVAPDPWATVRPAPATKRQ